MRLLGFGEFELKNSGCGELWNSKEILKDVPIHSIYYYLHIKVRRNGRSITEE